MLLAVYLSFLLPFGFLLLIIKGEGRGIIASFAWGMSSVMIIYFVSVFYETRVPDHIQIVFMVPILEEIVKDLPLFFMVNRLQKSLKFSLPRFALAIGLSFSILENSLYLSMMDTSGESLPAVFMALRSLTTSLLHGSTCSFVAYVLQILKTHEVSSPLLVAGAFASGAALHMLYNFLWMSPRFSLFAVILPLAAFSFMLFTLNAYNLSINFTKRRVA
jgi:hypothetical protein